MMLFAHLIIVSLCHVLVGCFTCHQIQYPIIISNSSSTTHGSHHTLKCDSNTGENCIWYMAHEDNPTVFHLIENSNCSGLNISHYHSRTGRWAWFRCRIMSASVHLSRTFPVGIQNTNDAATCDWLKKANLSTCELSPQCMSYEGKRNHPDFLPKPGCRNEFAPWFCQTNYNNSGHSWLLFQDTYIVLDNSIPTYFNCGARGYPLPNVHNVGSAIISTAANDPLSFRIPLRVRGMNHSLGVIHSCRAVNRVGEAWKSLIVLHTPHFDPYQFSVKDTSPVGVYLTLPLNSSRSWMNLSPLSLDEKDFLVLFHYVSHSTRLLATTAVDRNNPWHLERVMNPYLDVRNTSIYPENSVLHLIYCSAKFNNCTRYMTTLKQNASMRSVKSEPSPKATTQVLTTNPLMAFLPYMAVLSAFFLFLLMSWQAYVSWPRICSCLRNAAETYELPQYLEVNPQYVSSQEGLLGNHVSSSLQDVKTKSKISAATEPLLKSSTSHDRGGSKVLGIRLSRTHPCFSAFWKSKLSTSISTDIFVLHKYANQALKRNTFEASMPHINYASLRDLRELAKEVNTNAITSDDTKFSCNNTGATVITTVDSECGTSSTQPHRNAALLVSPDNSDSPIKDRFFISFNRITILGSLGMGAFGRVSSAILSLDDIQETRITVAIKKIKGCNSQAERRILNKEIDLLKLIGPHPHVVHFFGFSKTPLGADLLVLEYCARGDLKSYLELQSMKPFHQVSLLYRFALEIVSGMNHLAGAKIVHRDLAARNILLTDNLSCKIGDFGLSRQLDIHENYYKFPAGNLPIQWMPPEVMAEKKYSSQSDVWSFGILLWEIFSLGQGPYSEFKATQILDLIQNGYRLPQPLYAGTRIYGLMQCCWSGDSHCRPDFKQITVRLEKARLEDLSRGIHVNELI